MAQTTHLASFGPVFVVVALPVTDVVEYNLFIQLTLVRIQKKHEEKKKNSLRAQTTQDASFGPVFVVVVAALPYLLFHFPACPSHFVTLVPAL
jgi:hypothetical protein